jgi:hypothetical protein
MLSNRRPAQQQTHQQTLRALDGFSPQLVLLVLFSRPTATSRTISLIIAMI